MKIEHNTELIDIKTRLPVIPLRDVVVFPHMIYPLLIGRRFTVKALQKALDSDKQVFLVAQRRAGIDDPQHEDLFEIGVVARILQIMKLPNGTYKALVEGLTRGRVVDLRQVNDCLEADVDLVTVRANEDDKETEALSRTVAELFAEYVRLNRRIPDEVLVSQASVEGYDRQADSMAAHILVKIDARQRLLEAFEATDQFRILAKALREEIEILKIEQRIDGSVRDSMLRSQREFYLQQQLKAIKDELGQYEEPGTEVDDLYGRLESGSYPDAVRAKAEEEIQKLGKMHPYSAEAAVVRGYIDWLLDLPWEKTTKERADFNEVRQILDGDHYGLDKAKRRIVEHLAVLRLSGKARGPIICFVGPPGVGKTSVGRSIARALGREFVRMSLGGVHDEAEIRGHRRTYIGAMPGRIIQALKKANSSNPVFLLDEIDKINRDFRGDPAAALLEALDPEQNNSFIDNYLEIEYDLSKALFLTTANTLATIPPALLDRMETIRLPGYLDFEKNAIARDYLVPKLIKEHGLEGIDAQFETESISEIIQYYTREAGVRELERRMSAVLRKTAVKIAEGKKLRKVRFTPRKVREALGPRKYVDAVVKPAPTVGYAVGLAWTSVGGEVLPVEVAPMKGKGKLTLTGSLGDVMRESATAALSYIRMHSSGFGLKDDFFEKLDLHIHLPEGAVPKDGPSAGITLTTALLSTLTDIPVRTDIAMTGEITLTGDVLSVGGLNEKLLAAKRLGITEIILPEKNRKDIAELQPELLDGLQLRFVKKISDVLKLAMVESPFAKKRSRPGRLTARPHR